MGEVEELRARVAHLESELAKAEALASEDSLTGIPNRRALDRHLEAEASRCDRTGALAAALMIDIDHFKHFNDEHGHEAGDAVLSAVARAIAGVCRGSDFCARYGGEEFTVIMGGLDEGAAEKAELFAERVRGTVELVEVEGLPQVTVSIGYAAGRTSAIMGEADAALYRAKAAGRNCVSA